MKNKITALLLAAFMLLALAACSEKPQLVNPSPNKIENTPEPIQTPSPEPTPIYNFDEIVAVTPTKFLQTGNEFNIISKEENYYGEITIDGKSYVNGASGSLEGTYAVFIVDSGSASVIAEIKKNGYYAATSDTGVVTGNAVEYPFNRQANVSNMITCKKGDTRDVFMNNLSHVVVQWGSNQTFSEWVFDMLAVVFTKDEAVRYVQDGTLPKCLQGLTVTGLDEILVKPDYEPGEMDDVREAEANLKKALEWFRYIENDDGSVTIQKYVGVSGGNGEIILPNVVTGIDEFAFSGSTSVDTVTIPDSVTVISKGMFMDCTGLRSVIIPDSVTVIGDSAFQKCRSLKSITIPDSVTVIGDSAFLGTALADVTIPDSVTVIGEKAFSGVPLTNVIIPNTVTTIGDGVFSSTAVTSVTIPANVTEISANMFLACKNLTNVTITDGVTSIGGGAFRECSNLTSVIIPDSVTDIGRNAFENCPALDEETRARILEINPDAYLNS